MCSNQWAEWGETLHDVLDMTEISHGSLQSQIPEMTPFPYHNSKYLHPGFVLKLLFWEHTILFCRKFIIRNLVISYTSDGTFPWSVYKQPAKMGQLWDLWFDASMRNFRHILVLIQSFTLFHLLVAAHGGVQVSGDLDYSHCKTFCSKNL